MNPEFSYLSEVTPDKGNLIKGLQLVQGREGYVSDEAIHAVGEYFSLADAEVEGVLTFMRSSNAPNRVNTRSAPATALPAISRALP